MKADALALALALIMGAAMTTNAAFETETVTFDGVWWQSIDYGERLTALQGMLDGMNEGRATAGADNLFKPEDPLFPRPEFSKTFGQYVHAIDAFYVSYPTLSSSIHPSAVLYACLADRPSYKSCHAWTTMLLKL